MSDSFGVYFHIPYCLQRCTYCDFATYVHTEIKPPEFYIAQVKKEIRNRTYTVAPFGSVALRVWDQLAVLVDWPGQDLNAGLMIAPFKDFPLVFTPQLVDITGLAGTYHYGNLLARPRFSLGTGFNYKF